MADNIFYGESLRLGRLYAGLTLADLGERVGVSRQFIHQLEVGTKPNASKEMVEALADVLDIYPRFLLSQLDNEVKEEQCHFRSQRSTLVSTAQQTIAHGTLFDYLVSYIDNRLSLPPVNFPQIDIRDDNDIEQAALFCRNHWELTADQPISNMIRVVENAGAVVTMFEGVSGTVDAFSIDRARPIIIRSTVKQSPSRLRFDIAHECGHLVMHKGIHTGDEKTERQADRFAGGFLLPKEEFIKQFPKGRRLDWIAIFRMKRYWQVSAQAIVRRAHDLGLIDHAQYKTACVFISKNGYRKNEPYEPKESESPELLKIAFGLLQKHFKIKPADVASHLGLKPHALSKLVGFQIPGESAVTSANIIDLNRYRGVI